MNMHNFNKKLCKHTIYMCIFIVCFRAVSSKTETDSHTRKENKPPAPI